MRSDRFFIELHTNVGIQKWNAQKMNENNKKAEIERESYAVKWLQTILLFRF